MPLWDQTNAGTTSAIGKFYDQTAAGTIYQTGSMWEQNAASTSFKVYDAQLDIFNPALVGWVVHTGNVSNGSTVLGVSANGVNVFSAARTSSKINLAGYSTLYATAACTTSTNGGYVYTAISTDTGMPTAYSYLSAWKSVGGQSTQSVSLASYQGAYYLWFICWSDSNAGAGNMTKMYAV